MKYALLNFNHGTHHVIQTQGSHYTTALDIICSQMVIKSTAARDAAMISNETKQALITELTKTINESVDLTPDQKDSFANLISARVSQGLAKGFIVKLQDILVDLGAIDLPISRDVKERVRFVDTLRNSLVHEGKLPLPKECKGISDVQSASVFVVYKIIPEILKQSFIIAFEIEKAKIDQFGLMSSMLRDFFTNGVIETVQQFDLKSLLSSFATNSSQQ